MLASITKWTNDLCDDTCILDRGEHPFLSVKSFVLYRKVRIELCNTLILGVENGTLIPRDPFADPQFIRICDGIASSKYIPWKMKQAFKKWNELR